MEDVYGGGLGSPKKMEAPPQDDKTSLEVLLAWLGPRAAWAKSASTVSNAAIRDLKEQTTRNHGQLKAYSEQGSIGITNKDLLDIRETKGLSMAEVAKLKRLVAEDNQARQQLYREVAVALSVPASQIEEVQRIFATELQSKAPSGYLIQGPSGVWRRK